MATVYPVARGGRRVWVRSTGYGVRGTRVRKGGKEGLREGEKVATLTHLAPSLRPSVSPVPRTPYLVPPTPLQILLARADRLCQRSEGWPNHLRLGRGHGKDVIGYSYSGE